MLFPILKAAISGILIAVVSETAKRSAAFGALIASLPLVSVISMIWLWQETKDADRIANHAEATFWFVLPSLPMFLLLPYMLRNGTGFYLSLAVSCLVTIVLYFLMLMVLKKFGIEL